MECKIDLLLLGGIQELHPQLLIDIAPDESRLVEYQNHYYESSTSGQCSSTYYALQGAESEKPRKADPQMRVYLHLRGPG